MTSSVAFDSIRYKQTTRDQWEEAAAAWHGWGPTLEQWLGAATETMLDATRVGAGSRVLDVAAGAGGQSLVAAARGASVLATDISPAILAHAARDAAHRGMDVTVREADGEELDVDPAAFDAVISRLGLIYLPDRARALAGMYRALAPGGRIGAIVYSVAERNTFFSVPVGIIRRRAALPPPAPGQPGPFTLGAPGALEAELRSAGFHDVGSRTLDAPLLMPDAATCVRFERESFGALHQMLAGITPPERERAWAEIAAELAGFETAEGFSGPCELVVAWGTK